MNDKKDITQGEFGTLQNPPIVEAVIEIQCSPESGWDETSMIDAINQSSIGYDFLDSRYGYPVSLQFQDGEASSKTVEKNWLGSRYRSNDERYITTFFSEVFACSRLAPYENWETLSHEALRLWEIYREVVSPTEIRKLNLRYINRIPMSEDKLDIEFYIVDPPKSPEGLAPKIARFLHKDFFIDSEDKFVVNLTKTLQRPEDTPQKEFALILDINVSIPALKTQTFGSDFDQLASVFDEMRALKNKVFFGTITEELRNTFDGA